MEEDRILLGANVLAIDVVELVKVPAFTSKRLDQFHPDDVLGQVRIHCRHGLPDTAVRRARTRREPSGQSVHDRKHDHRHQCQPHAHGEHQRDRAEKHEDVCHRLQQPLRQDFVHRGDIACIAGNDVPNALPIVVAQAQLLEMREHVGSQRIEDPLTHPRKHPCLEVGGPPGDRKGGHVGKRPQVQFIQLSLQDAPVNGELDDPRLK